MEKVVGLPFMAWEHFPVMGCNRKSLSQKLARHFISYFIYSPQPSWMCGACQRGSGCPTRRAGVAQQDRTCLEQGKLGKSVPPTHGARVWLGWEAAPRTGTGTAPGHPRAATGSAHSSGREHGGLGRISKGREDGGAEDGRAEGWQGLGLVRQHMPLTGAPHVSSNHPLVALLL